MKKVQPAIVVTREFPAEPEVYHIEAQQELPGSLLSAGGRRMCVMVVGQSQDDETQIIFKVLEYKTQHKVAVQGLLNFTDNVASTPVHPTRIGKLTDKMEAQLKEGVSIITECIQRAIGQAAAGEPTVPK